MLITQVQRAASLVIVQDDKVSDYIPDLKGSVYDTVPIKQLMTKQGGNQEAKRLAFYKQVRNGEVEELLNGAET